MNVGEALEVADDLENHDSADPAKAVVVLATEVRRLRLIEQRAHVVHTTKPQNEHDHTMRGTARYILRGPS